MASSSNLRRYRFSKASPNSFFAVVAGPQDVGVGTPVAPNPDLDNPGSILIALGTSEGRAAVVGLATSANEPGQRTNIQYQGPLSQPTDKWDVLTGQTGGLTTGARYYLTNDPKRLGTNPAAADFPVQVGIGISADTMLIRPDPISGDVGFCPDGVAVTYHVSQAGFPVSVLVDWDPDNCTLDITQISNLGTQPTVQDLINALAVAGWTYDPGEDIGSDRLESDNAGTATVNCMGNQLSLSWGLGGLGGIAYTTEGGPEPLPGATTTDC